jgi:hypothetical protein
MMAPRAPATGLPRCDQRVRAATAAAPAATTTRTPRSSSCGIRSPCCSTNSATNASGSDPPTGPCWRHCYAHSPGPRCSNFGCSCAQTPSCAGPASCSTAATPPSPDHTYPDDPHTALDPHAGPTAGPREQHLGLPAHPRRTAHPRDQGRRLHNLGNPPRRRYRSRTGQISDDLGNSSAPKPKRCWPPTSSKRSHSAGNRAHVQHPNQHPADPARSCESPAHSWCDEFCHRTASR